MHQAKRGGALLSVLDLNYIHNHNYAKYYMINLLIGEIK